MRSTSWLVGGVAVPSEFDLFRDGFCGPNGHLTVENGEPLILEEFQLTMLADYFAGATETLTLVPKKSGKSTLMAGLALFRLVTLADADIVIAAASRDQAGILFGQAAGFVRRSAWLRERVRPTMRELRSRRDAGAIRVLAADVDTADGWLGDLAIVDELHRHKSAELYGVLRDGLGPRGGQMLTISTAGDDEESALGVMRQAAYQLATVKRDGAYRYCRSADGAYAMHEWALDDGEDRDDMAVVKRANPASWQTEDALRRRHDSPSMTPWGWARFACGVWVRGESTAIQPGEWDALAEAGLTIPPGSPVWVGLDLGWKIDTTALVPVWLEREDRRVVADVTVLQPPGDGSLLDDRLIVGRLLELADRYRVEAIVYDPAAGGQQMVQQLEREHRLTFVEHSQDSSPIAKADAQLMEAIRRKAIVHDGDRTLRAHVLNAVEKPLGGERFRFDRPSRGPRKPNDALRALSIAHAVAISARPKSKAVVFL